MRDTAIPWRLLGLLTLVFLVVWLMPDDGSPHDSPFLFPVSVHTLCELVAVIIALLIFAVSWHSYGATHAGNVLLLACGFLAAGLFDTGHMLSYRGMPDWVTPASPNKAINFWLMARYSAAATLLLVALRPWQPYPHRAGRYLALGAVLLLVVGGTLSVLLAPHWWPVMFIDGQGQTAIKLLLEGGAVMLMAAAAMAYLRQARSGDSGHDMPALLFSATLMIILSELSLMLYSHVNDLFSLVGHLYKALAYFFIYRAVFVTTVRAPYQRLQVEVSERKQAENRAAYLAYHDALTELPNRLLLRDRAELAIGRAARTRGHVVLAYVDLDHFKTVNDSLGHERGDQLLRLAARRFQQHVRSVDTLSRMGGDEFAVILPDLLAPEQAMPVLGRLLEVLSEPYDLGGERAVVSASMGIAVYPEDGRDFDTLLKRADMAMYRAKAAGRNTYRFYDEQMNSEASEQLAISNGLRDALTRGDFEIHYQPQFDLASGRLEAAEALIRWRLPNGELVPPLRFIPVAEDTALIVPIGAWLVEQVCQQAMAWQRAGLGALRIAVNLSAVQFARPGLVEMIKGALARSGLDPALLELELTESILIRDTDHVLDTVRQLKALGLTLAVDDFGTGYSSLQYLRRFAVDRLKIDKSFVADLAVSADAVAIVRAVIDMARSLGLRTIAEGVESGAIAERLRALGCDEAQGYFYARPLPPDQFAAFVRAHAA
ncbi:bifunctional diguanylate cyclase/phosphodiesterase [Massilia sp. TS11]|uniref:putative bifunctional diguanylate cyclase/phosphodiesterase n=1 Tax=Massilia sp. TS11 TaxID=2908003 RepID=UPI001EDBFEA7|nr:EAL domain-containing protein [Massilia sp. TS11]MCG2584853.1 EAL domain-containing protein [Massilia sp. TS11]